VVEMGGWSRRNGGNCDRQSGRSVVGSRLLVLDWRAPRAAVLSALEEQHVLGAEHRLEARQARANDVEAEFHDQEDRKINNIHF